MTTTNKMKKITSNKRKKRKGKKETRSGNDEYMKNEGYHGMELFTRFCLFFGPPFLPTYKRKYTDIVA